MTGARERLGEPVLMALLSLQTQKGPYSGEAALEIADALLPVVQALVAEGQAEALPDGSEAHYAGMQAVREMASDWYCPRSKPGRRQRRDCPECVAEVALDAALAHVYGDALRAAEVTT